MKKIDKDPFSNGTEHMRFEECNCDKCIKDSHYNEKTENYTKYKCKVQQEIHNRMFSKEPIRKLTVYICDNFTLYGSLCPFLETKRKKYVKKLKNQLELGL